MQDLSERWFGAARPADFAYLNHPKVPRTTNGLEGLFNGLQRRLHSNRPALSAFVAELRQEMGASSQRLWELSMGTAPVHRRRARCVKVDKLLLAAYRQYRELCDRREPTLEENLR